MALQIPIPTDYSPSVSAVYWRIVAAEYDADAQCLAVTAAGYVSADDRNAGRPPIDARRFRFTGIAPSAVSYDLAYLRLAAEPASAGASAV